MTADSYIAGMSYANFICKAYNLDASNQKHFSYCAKMRNLIDAENGGISISKSVKKQFDDVKGYLTKAIDKYLTRKEITLVQREKLEELKERTNYVINSSGLMNIVEDGLEIVSSN